MFKGMKIKAAIKFVAKELPKRLIVKYGRKSAYECSEIDWALTAVGKNKNKEKDNITYNIAYAMLADKSVYISMSMTSVYGDIQGLHRLFSDTLANTSDTYTIEFALTYSESIDSVHPTSSISESHFGADASIGGGE